MKLNFTYHKEKDVWCLLNKGKSSINSPFPTLAYTQLILSFGDNPSELNTGIFIDQYIQENEYNVSEYIKDCQKDFNFISKEYQQIAEKVFNVSLDSEITVYLTVNNRCPYSIEQNWFFVSISKKIPTVTMMHELWHFYTWYKFGVTWEEKIGKQKYNEIKEALTVLLNIECKDLLPEGVTDMGYPQHAELREKILLWWSQNPDIEDIFEKSIKFIS